MLIIALFSDLNVLPEKLRRQLEGSWAGTFYQEVFVRIDEEPFAVLYSDEPSRPNTPINILMGLDWLKSAFGWSDEELYDHYCFDLQVRYALGCGIWEKTTSSCARYTTFGVAWRSICKREARTCTPKRWSSSPATFGG